MAARAGCSWRDEPMVPLLLMLLAAPTAMDQAIDRAVDPCKAARATDGIVVCGRDAERQRRRYRLPDDDHGFVPDGPVESVSRERHRLLDGVQDQTRGSCSAVGASGFTGCMIQSWREKDHQPGGVGAAVRLPFS